MSEEQLNAFLAKLADDPALQERLKQDDADPIAIAKEAGFDVRQADLIRYQARKSLDLADEELEQLAGGGGWLSITCPTACRDDCKKTDQCFVFSCNF